MLILQQIDGHSEPYVRQSALQIGRVTVEWNAWMEMMRLGVKRAGKQRSFPVPTDNQVLYRARNRGRLPCCPGKTPPLLWQLVGTRQLRRHAQSYRYWRPPVDRPYAAWPLVGQIATTVGLTVLAQAGMATWCLLRDLGLVDTGDELAVKDILGVAG